MRVAAFIFLKISSLKRRPQDKRLHDNRKAGSEATMSDGRIIKSNYDNYTITITQPLHILTYFGWFFASDRD